MGYIEDSLGNNEHVVFRTRLHWFPSALFLVIGAVIYISDFTPYSRVLAGIFAVIAIVYYISISTSEFAVTDRKVLIKYGILSVVSLEIVLGKVESIGVSQSIIGRIMGFGSLIISGTGTSKQVFYMIENPVQFKRHVSEAIENRNKN